MIFMNEGVMMYSCMHCHTKLQRFKARTERRNWTELYWHGFVFLTNWPMGKQ